MSDLKDMFDVLLGCCLHEPQWLPEDVDKILCWVGDRQNGSDSSSIVIVRLKTRAAEKPYGLEYGLLTQSEDYTGHGCQCDSMTVRESSLSRLLTHLTDMDLFALLEREGGER